ncbi:MAG TPA: enoyl-CoA hydratase-related protein [Rhodocyclaceae bacterium]|jgi:methylglutaconyl-CoA hydratase|nr:enoyl-CoA hydratase-related protein [Rhodocyclaceae bacterium]
MSGYQNILTELDHGVGIITLNRPDRHNAIDGVLVAELSNALSSMAADSSVRVVVLSSVGDTFCAGSDMQWLQSSAAKSDADNLADARAVGALLRALSDCPKPTVARIQGPVLGGGLGFVAACDIAIATFDAEFALTETQRGLIPGVIAPYVMNAIGARHARRYMLTAERFSASEAYRLGLVHEIVADNAALDSALSDLINALLGNGPVALAECKTTLAVMQNRPLSAELIDHMAQRSARVRAGAEGREGIAAFLEKRLPSWAPK